MWVHRNLNWLKLNEIKIHILSTQAIFQVLNSHIVATQWKNAE